MVTLSGSPSTELPGITYETPMPAIRGPGSCPAGSPPTKQGQANPLALIGDIFWWA